MIPVRVTIKGVSQIRQVDPETIRYGIYDGAATIKADLVRHRTKPSGGHLIPYVPSGSGTRFYLRAEFVNRPDVVASGRRRRALGRGLRVAPPLRDCVLIKRVPLDPGVPIDPPAVSTLIQARPDDLRQLTEVVRGLFGGPLQEPGESRVVRLRRLVLALEALTNEVMDTPGDDLPGPARDLLIGACTNVDTAAALLNVVCGMLPEEG